MPIILNIETSSTNCSVSLSNNNKLIDCLEKDSPNYSHSQKLHSLISELMEKNNISFKDLDAVAVGIGPGSYTGLRIGLSAAKGICYALDIPLISVSTLKAMSSAMILKQQADLYCPMIDARRMEVYSAIFDANNNQLRDIQADIIDGTSYKKELEKVMVFFGDGSEKAKDIIRNKNAIFIQNFYPSAKYMGVLSYQKFTKSDFEDLAYFEPFYLKDFVAGKKS